MPRIDIDKAPVREGSDYPAPYDQPCATRHRRKLGDIAGLDQFGVNLLTLPPGAWSAQRHWHSREDEFVWVLEGEVVLVTDGGEEVLRAGECAGFKAGVPDGHHLINRSDRDARVLEVGTRTPEGSEYVDYPDIDVVLLEGSTQSHHRDGTPYSS